MESGSDSPSPDFDPVFRAFRSGCFSKTGASVRFMEADFRGKA